MNTSLKLSESLKVASKFIDDREYDSLKRDVDLICQQLNNSCFGIALLAPFNFGKSTLINSLLGVEIMPTKIVRTTGAAVKVKYGKTLKIIVILQSGESIISDDTSVLKDFAVLNRQGERRKDVVSIEVQYPNELLRGGVELFDLPGTNDSEVQDDLVRNQILQVDLVVQLLDAKQPFTMLEQETLRRWLIDRGIEAVVFALNKVNQLESKEDRKEVYDDVSSTVNVFKSDYLKGLKKLYRVDALPAIRAKQNGDIVGAISSGIVFFEAALLTIVALEREKVKQSRLPRVTSVAARVRPVLKIKISKIEAEVKESEKIRNTTIKAGQQREANLRKEFKEKVESYQDWLQLNNLLASCQINAAQALESNCFHEWRDNEFLPIVLGYTKRIEKSLTKSCNEFRVRFPGRIDTDLPSSPCLSMPEKKARNNRQRLGDFFNGGQNLKKLDDNYEKEKWQTYKKAASTFLSDFSRDSLATTRQYEKTSIPLITFHIPEEEAPLVENRHILKEMNSSLNVIQKICSMEAKTQSGVTNVLQGFKAAVLFCTNYVLCVFRIKWHRLTSIKKELRRTSSPAGNYVK